jgi:NitT/TauT family transport system permease protein/taurine transport system permease protein
MMRRLIWRFLPAVPAVIALLAWWAWFAIDRPPPSVMPSVTDVIVTMSQLAFGGRLAGDIVASLARLLTGVAVGIVTGIVAGFIAGLNRPVASFVNPLVVFFNAISGIVWLPLVIGWLGIGSPLAIFLIWNTVFFIVFQNTVLGVQLVAEVLELSVRSLGGGRWETIRSVTLPGALPYILSGIRSGLGFGWRALIAAELVGATTGLGQLIFSGAEYHRADIIVGTCLLIGALAMAMDRWLLLPIERRTVVRWGLVASGRGR